MSSSGWNVSGGESRDKGKGVARRTGSTFDSQGNAQQAEPSNLTAPDSKGTWRYVCGITEYHGFIADDTSGKERLLFKMHWWDAAPTQDFDAEMLNMRTHLTRYTQHDNFDKAWLETISPSEVTHFIDRIERYPTRVVYVKWDEKPDPDKRRSIAEVWRFDPSKHSSYEGNSENRFLLIPRLWDGTGIFKGQKRPAPDWTIEPVTQIKGEDLPNTLLDHPNSSPANGISGFRPVFDKSVGMWYASGRRESEYGLALELEKCEHSRTAGDSISVIYPHCC